VRTFLRGLAIALAWEIAARIFPWHHVLPPPSAILFTLVTTWGSLYPHLLVTGQEALYGYLWGNALAIFLALAAFLFPPVEPVLGRIILTIHCLPLLVLAPILQIVFSNLMPMIILSGLFVVFTTFISALIGLRQVDQQSLLVVRAFGGSKKDELLRVRLTAWLPSLIAGLAQAAPAAVVGAMVGEYMGSTRGLGIAMVYAQTSFQVERTWALCLLATALALLGYGAVQAIGWWLTPWARDNSSIVLATMANDALPGNKWMQRLQVAGLYLGCLAGGVGLWYAVIWICSLDPYFAKTPGDLWVYLVTDPQAGDHRRQFLQPTVVTLGHAAGGLVLGFGFAVVTALVLRFWRSLENALTPYLVFLASVPIAGLIPIISLICGLNAWAVMAAVAILTFVPSFITIFVGFKSAPDQASALVWVAGGSLWRAVWSVQLPFATPWLIAALKSAAPMAVGGSLLGEWLITGDGLATVMEQSRDSGDYTAIWAASIWIVLISLALFTLISLLESPILKRLALRPT